MFVCGGRRLSSLNYLREVTTVRFTLVHRQELYCDCGCGCCVMNSSVLLVFVHPKHLTPGKLKRWNWQEQDMRPRTKCKRGKWWQGNDDEFKKTQIQKYLHFRFSVCWRAEENVLKVEKTKCFSEQTNVARPHLTSRGKQNSSGYTRQKWVMWNRHIQQPICSYEYKADSNARTE